MKKKIKINFELKVFRRSHWEEKYSVSGDEKQMKNYRNNVENKHREWGGFCIVQEGDKKIRTRCHEEQMKKNRKFYNMSYQDGSFSLPTEMFLAKYVTPVLHYLPYGPELLWSLSVTKC